jgi:hypothetical protein
MCHHKGDIVGALIRACYLWDGAMQPQDVFRQQFDRTVDALEAWAAKQSVVAEVAYERSTGYWRLSVAPRASGACSVELILHRNQTFDIQVGSETYEAQPIDNLDLFEPLLSAIVAGNVITRTMTTSASGAAVAVQTLIGDMGGLVWQAQRKSLAARMSASLAAVVRDRHYLPYLRKRA